jgi:zinc protease
MQILNQWLRRQRLLLCFGLTLSAWLLVLLMQPPATAAPARHYTELTFPPLPEVEIPEYSRYTLENGMVVYLMEDHELPLVSGTVLVKTGERMEPAEQTGLAGITAEVMRSGGTRQHSADELNQLLEQRAASVEAGMSTAFGSVSFNALSQDLDLVLDLFAEVIQDPLFPQEKLDLANVQRQGAIARRNDNPNDIAGRELQKLIYGKSSPYARTVEYATLANIARLDLVNFYQRFYRPDQMILGIAGDFDSTQMRSLIKQKFGSWRPSGAAQPPAIPAVEPTRPGGIFLVDQPQLTQSYIQMGHLGGQLDNPDVFSLYVMNGVLNGFGGRLFNEVRSRQGLAYVVYAAWSPQYDYPGKFIAAGQTQSATTVPFIQAVQQELKQLQTTPITATELAYAKDSILNSFVFNFQQPEQTLSRLMRYEYFGYPLDFLFRYQRGVKATTIADVQRVAQTYLKPEDTITLVVGNAKAIQPPLTALQQPVTPVDITIPPPQA